MSELRDRAVLVTGAGGGLGRPITERLAQAGARLVVSGRDPAKLEGLPGHPVTADLRLPGEPERLVEAAREHLGGLDGIVHAAGVVAFGPAADADDDLLDELFLADALGPIRLLRAGIAHLEGPDAFAVVVSAVVAERPQPGMAAYSAAKAAASAFTLALAKEVRRQVRVIDVRPPHTETGLADRPIAGTAPGLPAGLSPEVVADRIVRAIVEDERELPAAAFS